MEIIMNSAPILVACLVGASAIIGIVVGHCLAKVFKGGEK